MRFYYRSLPAEWQADFREYQRSLARRFCVLACAAGLLIIPLFQVADLWLYDWADHHWWEHMAWRLPPVVTAVGALFLNWRLPEGNWPRPMLVLYCLSGMLMMTGLMAEHLGGAGEGEGFMAKGLVVVIALVAVLATAGARDLVLTYGIPALALGWVVMGQSLSAVEWFSALIHPMLMAVLGIVVAEELLRVRLAAFAARQELARNASTDVLTGLANRRAFDERLEAEHARSLRVGSGYALVMTDLDHFKHVNDTWGHEVGDEVLRELAQRLVSVLRTEDMLGRWGGEEFMALLPGAGEREAMTVAEKLRHAVADTLFATSAGSIPVTTSLGVAVFRGEQLPGMVARRADIALYAAKENGRNRSETA
ncbi:MULTISPECIES: GGDEF domain-containing protein [Halomonadaceae]